jgi:hydroxymethylbilane synthase
VSAAPLRLGSRGSALARAQAEWTAERIPGPVALVWIRTEGDEQRGRPLREIGGTGVFTAALHRALLEDRVDAAVHSMKDLPVVLEEGVTLAAVPVREDPRDALVSRDGSTLARLPRGARVATGSPRRAAEVLRARPDARIVSVRGNVDTRLEKLRAGQCDAIVLALAGLRRIGRDDEASEAFEPDVMLPAPAQGALAVTIRSGDGANEDRLRAIVDVRSAAAVSAERAALHGLGAGCHAPVGALAVVEDGRLRLRVRVLSLDGRTALDESVEGAISQAEALGARAADALLAKGAAPLVAAGDA